MVRLEPTGEFVVGCVPALAHLSMKLIAKAAGAKSAAMADPAVAQRRTGYVPRLTGCSSTRRAWIARP